ncbi:MAG: hypothetical protein J1E40_09180 [Oscillospiraceae bacterium]|nr:hypothetical protein [Oscillospiraceae bacterium]
MKNKSTKYFNFFYSDTDINIIDQIITEVDGMYERVINVFELEKTPVMFDLYLCPDVESYKSYAMVKDEDYQDWMVGNTDYINNRICILSPRTVKDRSFEYMIKVIRHEIIHIAFDALAAPDKVSICISEGIAVAFAEQIYIPCLDINNYPKYIDLLDEEYFYKNNGYTYSGCYILYLLKRYGTDTFKNIYSGKEDMKKYLFDGFEKEAISDLISNM